MEINRKPSPQIINELVKQWKLIGKLDEDDKKDLVFVNQENFWQRVKDLSKDEYQELAGIIWPNR